MKNYYYKWVGISEAIRLLPTRVKYLTFQCFIALYETLTLFISTYNLKGDSLQKEIIDTSLISVKNEVSSINSDPEKSTRNSGKGGDNKFNEWLAGIIDGDGCFQLSKKGYASLEIVTQLRDKRCLYLIKQKYGGAVKLYGGDNYLRYRLHHKAGLLDLINGVNGLIRNPVRILQLGRICEQYGIELKDPQTLTYYNGWLAGFFDTDGSIYLNEKAGQIYITATQKNRFLLDALVELYGGKIYTMVKQGAFKWTCYRKK